MKLENSFLVPAPIDEAWPSLLDVPFMVECMPGAELVGEIDESTWETKMAIKFGPVDMVFGTEVSQKRVDPEAHVVELKAKGRELRNRGAAQASVRSTLTGEGDGTRVDIATDLLLSGPAAQFGRGLVQDVSTQLVDQFAGNIRAAMGENGGAAGAAEANGDDSSPRPAKSAPPDNRPVSGLAIGFKALWAMVRRFFKRLLGRGD